MSIKFYFIKISYFTLLQIIIPCIIVFIIAGIVYYDFEIIFKVFIGVVILSAELT